jgi:hypothetical protein
MMKRLTSSMLSFSCVCERSRSRPPKIYFSCLAALFTTPLQGTLTPTPNDPHHPSCPQYREETGRQAQGSTALVNQHDPQGGGCDKQKGCGCGWTLCRSKVAMNQQRRACAWPWGKCTGVAQVAARVVAGAPRRHFFGQKPQGPTAEPPGPLKKSSGMGRGLREKGVRGSGEGRKGRSRKRALLGTHHMNKRLSV